MKWKRWEFELLLRYILEVMDLSRANDVPGERRADLEDQMDACSVCATATF
jgi:hypothetical protein